MEGHDIVARAVRQLLSGIHSGRKKRWLVQVNWRLIYVTFPYYMSIGFPQMTDLQLASHQTQERWQDSPPACILDLSLSL